MHKSQCNSLNSLRLEIKAGKPNQSINQSRDFQKLTPRSWLEQYNISRKLVLPTEQTIWRITAPMGMELAKLLTENYCFVFNTKLHFDLDR